MPGLIHVTPMELVERRSGPPAVAQTLADAGLPPDTQFRIDTHHAAVPVPMAAGAGPAGGCGKFGITAPAPHAHHPDDTAGVRMVGPGSGSDPVAVFERHRTRHAPSAPKAATGGRHDDTPAR